MVETTYYLDEGEGGASGGLPCGDPGTAACYDVGSAPDQLLTRTMVIALINSMLGTGLTGSVKKLAMITESQTYTFGATTNTAFTLLIGAGGGGGFRLMGGGGGGVVLGYKSVSAGGVVNITIGQGGAGGVDGTGEVRHGDDGTMTTSLGFSVTGARGGYGYGLYSDLGLAGRGGMLYTRAESGLLWAKVGGSAAPQYIGDDYDNLYISPYGASPFASPYGLPYLEDTDVVSSTNFSPEETDLLSYFGEANWYGTRPHQDGLAGHGGGAGDNTFGTGGGKGGDGLVFILELE